MPRARQVRARKRRRKSSREGEGKEEKNAVEKIMEAPPRALSAWQLRSEAERASSVIRVRGLQTSVCGPADAWGRLGRTQPLVMEAAVDLRSGDASAAKDALAPDTVNYGLLSKALLATVSRLGQKPISERKPLPLSAVLWTMWRSLTGSHPWGDGYHGRMPCVVLEDDMAEPLIRPNNASGLELTGFLPKASLLGDGVSFTMAATFSKGDGGRLLAYAGTLRLHGIRVPVLIGVNDNEREAKQAVVVDVEIDNYDAFMDLHPYLEDRVVKEMEKSSFATLEALAARLARMVSEYLRMMNQEPFDGSGSFVTVKVEKPIAVPFADAPSVELRTNTVHLLGEPS